MSGHSGLRQRTLVGTAAGLAAVAIAIGALVGDARAELPDSAPARVALADQHIVAGSPMRCPDGYTRTRAQTARPPIESIECTTVLSVDPDRWGELSYEPEFAPHPNCADLPERVEVKDAPTTHATRRVTNSPDDPVSGTLTPAPVVTGTTAARVVVDVQTAAAATHPWPELSNMNPSSPRVDIGPAITTSTVEPGQLLTVVPTYTEIRYRHVTITRPYYAPGPEIRSYDSGRILQPDGGLMYRSAPAHCS